LDRFSLTTSTNGESDVDIGIKTLKHFFDTNEEGDLENFNNAFEENVIGGNDSLKDPSRYRQSVMTLGRLIKRYKELLIVNSRMQTY